MPFQMNLYNTVSKLTLQKGQEIEELKVDIEYISAQ